MVASSPTVLKRWIAAELRRLRERAGVSRERAAEEIHGSVAGIGHMEVGRSLPGPLELERLLALYGIPERVPFWRDLRIRAKKGKDWWIGYGDTVSAYFNLFIGLESGAAAIEGWDGLIVPGLFQTEDYARAIFRGIHPGLTDAEVDQQVELRAARRRTVLDSDSPAFVGRVIAEGALRVEVSSKGVLRRQLDFLLEQAERPNVEFRVLPFSAGAHTGVDGTFDLLSFQSELDNVDSVVYVETRVLGYYYEQPDQVDHYRAALSRLQEQSIDPVGSLAFLHRIAKEL